MKTPARRGYSLIELLIALGLGISICVVAMTGVRVASQSITITNRLSQENRLMTSGIVQALDDLDFWTSQDVPWDPARQPLRSSGDTPAGSNPFRPLTIAKGDLSFDASRPANWWRCQPVGNPSSPGDTQHRHYYGDFSLLGHVGHSDSQLAWWHETCQNVNETLGHYGLIDYLPANAIYCYYGSDGFIPDEFLAEEINDPVNSPRFCIPNNSGTGDQPRDFSTATLSVGYTVTTEPWWLKHGVNRGGFSNMGGGWGTEHMHKDCALDYQLMAEKPAQWAGVHINIRRIFYFWRASNFASVTLASPLTGAAWKMNLSSLATTLRGARQQRGLDRYTSMVTP